MHKNCGNHSRETSTLVSVIFMRQEFITYVCTTVYLTLVCSDFSYMVILFIDTYINVQVFKLFGVFDSTRKEDVRLKNSFSSETIKFGKQVGNRISFSASFPLQSRT